MGGIRQNRFFSCLEKETVAFFEGKLKKDGPLQEDSATATMTIIIADNATYESFRRKKEKYVSGSGIF